MGEQLDVLQGTLDILILKAVSLGPFNGYGILLRILQISKDLLLTAAGKRTLQAETENWERLADVIAGIPGTQPEKA